MAEPIYHLAVASEWEAAVSGDGMYLTSTIGRSLADVGFIHCSFAHQVQQVLDLAYRGRDDVLLLTIDPELVGSEVRVENLDGGDDLFPHVYGPLPVAAVTAVARA